MIFEENATLSEKLQILSDAAKYDVACSSSGVDRKSKKGELGATSAPGICHTFAADGRCVSLLKILFTNECIYNCRYCINRVSNDVPRATFTPEEVCRLTMEFYRRNYIEGLFLSSGIVQSPDYTMELICKTLHDLRVVHRFNGYIHCKTIPGASPQLVEQAGWYADRMSINLELPTEEGLKKLAPNKTRRDILMPMRQVQSGMAESRELLGMKGGNRSAFWHTQKRMGKSMPSDKLVSSAYKQSMISADKSSDYKASSNKTSGLSDDISDRKKDVIIKNDGNGIEDVNIHSNKKSNTTGIYIPDLGKRSTGLTQWKHVDTSRGFVPAGQSTQMIIGATGESDYQILSVTEALYKKFDLKRVFYSAFINVNNDSALDINGGKPPLKREHRLYQADWLLRYYGFETGEILSENRPFFNMYLDPKCDWALSHLENFPVEINTADYNTLLRVPGIGMKSAGRIMGARKTGKVDFQMLKAMGVVMKRAVYFITCNGRMMYDFLKVEEDYITRNIISGEKDVIDGFGDNVTYKQLTLFDDFQLGSAE